MNKFLEKLKNINYKSKKAVICYIVAGAILISGTGTGIALYVNNNTNSDSIIEQSNTKGKKENDKKDTSTKPNEDKKEDKSHKVEKDKDNKKEDSKNSDKNKTDDKKPTSNKTDNNKNIVTTNTNNKKPTSNNTTISNSNNNKPTSPSEPSRPQPQPEQPNKPTEPSKPTPPAPKPPAHQHTWVPWTEEQEQFTTVTKTICNEPTCKEDFTGWKQSDVDQHTKDHLLKGENGGYHNEDQDVSTGFADVEIGHQCSSCGKKERY